MSGFDTEANPDGQSLAWGIRAMATSSSKASPPLCSSPSAAAMAAVIGMLGAWAKLCQVKSLNRAGGFTATVVRCSRNSCSFS